MTKPAPSLKPPRVRPVDLDQFQEIIELLPEEAYHDLYVKGVGLTGQECNLLLIEQSIFRNVRFDGTRFAKLRMRDAVLEACNLANAMWAEVSLERVEIVKSQLTGVDCSNARWKNVRVSNCKAAHGLFRFAKLTACRFENCDLKDCDFQGADLTGVVFADCDLSRAQFSQATLEDADMRGSQVEGIALSAADAKGLIVEPLQMMYFGQLFGMQVLPRTASSDEGTP